MLHGVSFAVLPNNTCSQRIENLPARTVTTVYNPPELPSAFLGSVVVEADQPVAVLVYEAGGGRYKCTNAFLTGHDVLYVPEVYNYKDSGGKTTGLVVQNTGNYATNITVTYYNVLGTQVGSPKVRPNIGAKRSAVFTPWDDPPGMPSNFMVRRSSRALDSHLQGRRRIGEWEVETSTPRSTPVHRELVLAALYERVAGLHRGHRAEAGRECGSSQPMGGR